MEQFFGVLTAALVSCAYVYFRQRIHHYNYKIGHKYRLLIKILAICCLRKVIKNANFEIGLGIKFALNRQSATLCNGGLALMIAFKPYDKFPVISKKCSTLSWKVYKNLCLILYDQNFLIFASFSIIMVSYATVYDASAFYRRCIVSWCVIFEI